MDVDPATFRARVEDEVADELDDLDSPRLLDALTGGEPTREALLAVAANSEHAARQTFEQWRADADERTRAAFDDLVAQERRHYDLVVGLLGEHDPVGGVSGSDASGVPANGAGGDSSGRSSGGGSADERSESTGGPLHAYLRSRDDPVERVGAGLVGRPLYTLRAHRQLLGFFEGRDPEAADVVERLRADTASVVDRGCDLLAALCEGEVDRERARMTAAYAVTVAHDDYRDGLAALDA